MDDLHERLEKSILAELADTAHSSQHDMFAELVMVAAQSIEKFNTRIMLIKKLKLMPDLVADLEPYTGINILDINRWAQWEQRMPSKPLEILALDRALRHFFCPEHHQHQSPSTKNKGVELNSQDLEITVRSLEKTIYEQDLIITILKAKVLKQTMQESQ